VQALMPRYIVRCDRASVRLANHRENRFSAKEKTREVKA
jgi:hypothetical protein